MRALETRDLGLFSKIISKMEIRKDITSLFTTLDVDRKEGMTDEEYQAEVQRQVDALNTQLMAELTLLLIENYHKAQGEVYKLLASLTDSTPNDIEKLPLKEFVGLLKQLAEDESIVDFFNLVA